VERWSCMPRLLSFMPQCMCGSRHIMSKANYLKMHCKLKVMTGGCCHSDLDLNFYRLSLAICLPVIYGPHGGPHYTVWLTKYKWDIITSKATFPKHSKPNELWACSFLKTAICFPPKMNCSVLFPHSRFFCRMRPLTVIPPRILQCSH